MRNSYCGCVRFGVFSFVVFLLLSGFCASAFAQGGTGTLTGTITDPKGLTVPDAKVVILNTETGIERSLSTTDAGVYTATFLQPGRYQVTAIYHNHDDGARFGRNAVVTTGIRSNKLAVDVQ